MSVTRINETLKADEIIELENINIEEIKAKQEKRKIEQTAVAALVVGGTDGATFGAIFSSFLSETFHKFVDETGKFFMFPFAAALAVLQAILQWRLAALQNYKDKSVMHAVIETVAALLISVAVVGSLAFAAAFTAVTPFIFIGLTVARALFNLGTTIYHLAKAYLPSFKPADASPEEIQKMKNEHLKEAKSAAARTVAGLFAGIGVTAVMAFAKPFYAVFVIVGAVIGTVLAIDKAVQIVETMQPAINKTEAALINGDTSTDTPKVENANDKSAKKKVQFKEGVDQVIVPVDEVNETETVNVKPALVGTSKFKSVFFPARHEEAIAASPERYGVGMSRQF